MRASPCCKPSKGSRAWRGRRSSRAQPRISRRHGTSAAGHCLKSGRAASRRACWRRLDSVCCSARSALPNRSHVGRGAAQLIVGAFCVCLRPLKNYGQAATTDCRVVVCCKGCTTLIFTGGGGPLPVVIAGQPVRRPHVDELGAHGAPQGPPHPGTAPVQVTRLVPARRVAYHCEPHVAARLVGQDESFHICGAFVDPCTFPQPAHLPVVGRRILSLSQMPCHRR